MVAIANALKTNQTLRVLDICCELKGAACASALGEMLAVNRTLISLDFGYVEFG